MMVEAREARSQSDKHHGKPQLCDFYHRCCGSTGLQ